MRSIISRTVLNESMPTELNDASLCPGRAEYRLSHVVLLNIASECFRSTIERWGSGRSRARLMALDKRDRDMR